MSAKKRIQGALWATACIDGLLRILWSSKCCAGVTLYFTDGSGAKQATLSGMPQNVSLALISALKGIFWSMELQIRVYL